MRNENKVVRRLVGIKFSGQRGNPLVEICGILRLETRLRNQRLRWFGHILRKPKKSLTLKVYNRNLSQSVGQRRSGRNAWKKIFKKMGLEESQAFERDLWKREAFLLI